MSHQATEIKEIKKGIHRTPVFSDWGKENLVLVNASNTQFFHLRNQQSLIDNNALFFDET